MPGRTPVRGMPSASRTHFSVSIDLGMNRWSLGTTIPSQPTPGRRGTLSGPKGEAPAPPTQQAGGCASLSEDCWEGKTKV